MTIAALQTGQRITFDAAKQDVIIGGREYTSTSAAVRQERGADDKNVRAEPGM